MPSRPAVRAPPGTAWADCLSLDGNPSVEDDWPTYTLEYVDAEGSAQSIELPLTTADWAATEGRFRKHFKQVRDSESRDDLVRFDEYLARSAEERDGKTPFIYMIGVGKRLERWTVATEIVRLAEERLAHWAQLRELAGLKVAESTRARIVEQLEADVEAKLAAVRAEYEAKLADVQASMPAVIARRLAEGLLKLGVGSGALGVEAFSFDSPVAAPVAPPVITPAPSATSAAAMTTDVPLPTPHTPHPTPTVDDDSLRIDPYIESERCTSCNECMGVNKKMFAYNADKQAYVKDATAGTFAQLVQAAEKCPVAAIHPGTPLNPKEKDLEKWLKRAQAF